MTARPELRTSHKDEEEQPDGKVAVEPRPDFESEQTQEADDPDSAIYRGKNTPTIERHYRYQVEQVDEKAEVGQRRPDGMHAGSQLRQKQADRGGNRACYRSSNTHLRLIFGILRHLAHENSRPKQRNKNHAANGHAFHFHHECVAHLMYK